MIIKIALLLIGLAIITRAAVFLMYDGIVRKCYSIQNSSYEPLKQIKLKYLNSKRLGREIVNTDAFSRRFILQNTYLKALAPMLDGFGYLLVIVSFTLCIYTLGSINATCLSGGIIFLLTDKLIHKEEKEEFVGEKTVTINEAMKKENAEEIINEVLWEYLA